MTFQLRDYQEYAVTQAVKGMRLEGNDLLVLSTGSGKSLIVAEIANRLNDNVLILQPSAEIAAQNIAKLKAFVPDWEIGIYSASMGQKKIRKYTFATIGSIYKIPKAFAHIGLIIADECHAIDPKNLSGMYGSFIKGINKIRKDEGLPNIKVIGLSATPYRNMIGYHTDPDTREMYATTTLKLINRVKPVFWDRILANVGMKDLIDQGYLCPIEYDNRAFLTHEELKLNASHTNFDLDDFSVKLGSRERQVVECIQECQRKFKSVLVFCPNVASANKYAELIAGAKSVSAHTPTDERDRIIRDFKSGKIQTVTNVNVLAVGFDHPSLDCIINLRPTRSMLLWVQLIGRVVRMSPGKTHGTVIDFTSNTAQLGKVETVEVRKEQFPEFKHPMWEIFSTTDKGLERWHNRALYSFAVKPQSKSFYAQRAMEKKKYGRRY